MVANRAGLLGSGSDWGRARASFGVEIDKILGLIRAWHVDCVLNAIKIWLNNFAPLNEDIS